MTVALVSMAFSALIANASPTQNNTSGQGELLNTTIAQPPVENSTIITYETETPGFSTMDTQHINPVNHTGTAAYTGEFTTAPENGKYLNVYCKNNGSGTVYMTIYRNGSEFVSELAISPGGQRTQTFEELYGTGITGNWKVYIFTKDGASMNIQVSARQY